MNDDIRLYETSEDQTTFYYSEMRSEKQVNVCMEFENNVGAPKPAALTIQDYYNPDAKYNKFYALERRKVWLFCNFERSKLIRVKLRANYADVPVVIGALS